MARETTPMYVSLTRPRLVAGCERIPLIGSWTLALFLPLIFGKLLIFLMVPLALVAMFILGRIGKKDAQWTAVYMRSLKYKDCPAHAHYSSPVGNSLTAMMRKKPFGR